MLSRVADAVYWMARYIERAENIARFIDVTRGISLGGAGHPASQRQWPALVYASGDEKAFLSRYGGTFREEHVLRFLTFDAQNPNSILSCLVAARENARSIRAVITTAMWEAVNRFYLHVRRAAADAEANLANPHYLLERVKRSSHQVIGVTEATLSHGEPWHFLELGRMLERADKTSRILDVKYFVLAPRSAQSGSTLDVVQWGALLESTGALHMYRKRFGRIDPESVVAFLVLDPRFPRSIRFCLRQAEVHLRELVGAAPGESAHPALALAGKLNERLNALSVEGILAHGLHEFVDDFQTRLNEIGTAIWKCFFELPPMTRQVQQQS